MPPDFKTIANFSKDNDRAISNVCKPFIVLCQRLGLFSDALVAVDGSKFKAVNNRDRNFTSAKLQRHMEEITASIEHYLTALYPADRQEPERRQVTRTRLHENVAALKAQIRSGIDTDRARPLHFTGTRAAEDLQRDGSLCNSTK